jgi:hypothetical protein
MQYISDECQIFDSKIVLNASSVYCTAKKGRINPANVEKVIAHTAASTPAGWGC